jgi:large subunit ribosomal protein L10
VEERPLNRSEKEEVISDLSKRIEGSKAVVLTQFRGLNVEQIGSLRRRLREEKISYHVVKNTLMKLASRGTDLEKVSRYLEGPTAIAFSYGDPVPLAKILSEFTKAQPTFEIKAGLIQGRLVSPDEVKALATMPPREVLLGQVLGAVQMSGSQVAGALLAALQQIAGVIQARVDQLESGQ